MPKSLRSSRKSAISRRIRNLRCAFCAMPNQKIPKISTLARSRLSRSCHCPQKKLLVLWLTESSTMASRLFGPRTRNGAPFIRAPDRASRKPALTIFRTANSSRPMPKRLRIDVKGDIRNEYIKPLRWLKPGILLLEQLSMFRGGGESTVQFTVRFDGHGKFQVISKKKVPSKE